MSFFSMAGRAGATTGSISIGPVYTHTTDVMSSSRDHNTKENTGSLPRGTNWLALFVQKKFDRLFRRKDPVAFKPGSSLHLLKNRELGGYFDYQAYHKYQLSRQKRSKGKRAKSERANSSMPPVNTKEVRVESPMDESTPIAQGSSRELIKEMLLRALPGLEADHEDWLSPTKERVEKAKASFDRRIERLEKDLQKLRETSASAALIDDAESEKARCEHCRDILKDARKWYEKPSRRNRSDFWRRNLEARWKKMHANDPANQDLFALVRKGRNVDAIAKQHHFIFLPQEICLLEMEIAVEELSDIDRCGMLDAEQFGDLIEALAHGWPGVEEDSQSPIPEDRANAAGCVRALAQLANNGELPREVISSFREFDAINLALLQRAQMRKVAKQREVEVKDNGKGKGKERVIDLPKPKQLEADIDALRKRGMDLAALHAELMEAERNLRAVGIDIRGVRVDEFYIQGLDNKDPEQRRQNALMLARVALIQHQIAKLDQRYNRHPGTDVKTKPSDFAKKITGMGVDRDGQPSTFVPAYSYPFQEGEVDEPIGARREQAINDRKAVDELLSLGLTAADLKAMKLPEGSDEKIEVIRKLGQLRFRNAEDVRFQHKMHRRMRDRVFKTRAGRRALRSAFGLTTGQLAAEYLHLFFSSATGNHDNFNHGAKDDMVVSKLEKHWGEVMGPGSSHRDAIAHASKKIESWRGEILKVAPELGKDPEADVARIAEIRHYHDEINKNLLAIEQMFTPRQRAFIHAMIRAAVLSARPRRTTGERHYDPIDVYEASRYRNEIDEILKSWGMDTACYEVLIDLVAFSRAEDSDLAPGTVTAKKLDQWKKELDPEEIFATPAPATRGKNAPRLPMKTRLEKLPKKAMTVVVEHFSGKKFRKMDAALIDRIVLSLPAMADMDKISVRVHSIGQGGFAASAGMGVRTSIAAGAGDQYGWIIKREGDHMLVRCLGGVFGYVQPGVGVGQAIGVGEVGGAAFLNGAGWVTPGVTLAFPIPLDKHGQEDFSKVQTYVRALLTGNLPTTEWMAENAALWYESDKSGGHAKVAGNIELVVGPAMETPLGPASAGASASVGLESRRRFRGGKNQNADGITDYWKLTDMDFLSAAASLGASFGYKYDPGIAEVASAAATAKLGIGVSASVVGMKYGNISLYDDGIDCTFDVTLDLGPIDMSGVTSIEEAFDQLRPDMAARLKPLLDKETTLDNGSKVIFREGLEKLLKMLRYNDGFLMEWALRPEVKKEVGRRLRRIAMIRQQRMLETLQARAEDERDPKKKRELGDAYRLLDLELLIHEKRIREMKDPKNLSCFEPVAIYIMPLLFQWDELTVLDILGMAKISHIGVRLQDNNCAWVPVPKEEGREKLATGDLDPPVDRRRQQQQEIVPNIPLTSSDDTYDERLQNTLDRLSGSYFPSIL